MITSFEEAQDGVDGAHAAGKGCGILEPLDFGHLLFESLTGGVATSSIIEALVFSDL